MVTDAAVVYEDAGLAVDQATHESVKWHCKWKVEKYHSLDVHEISGATPDEVIDGEGNLVMYGGVSCLWQCLIGNGTGTGAQTLTYFNNGNAYIGVGDSTTAEAATQTDLQAASNKARAAMVATYPQHTDATTSGAASIIFQSSFGSGAANFAWQEYGIFNASSGGRMLNRKVASLGTKSSGTWTITVTLMIT